MLIDRSLRAFFHMLPESSIKHRARRMYLAHVYKALLLELGSVPICESGLDGDNKMPYAVLQDGVILYGREPTDLQRRIYSQWHSLINPAITLETVGVAIDVICRYIYPHAMPQLTMHHPRHQRRAFHPQHRETIDDLPGLSRPKTKQSSRQCLRRDRTK